MTMRPPPPPPPRRRYDDNDEVIVEDDDKDRSVVLTREDRNLLRFALKRWREQTKNADPLFMDSDLFRKAFEDERNKVDYVVAKLGMTR